VKKPSLWNQSRNFKEKLCSIMNIRSFFHNHGMVKILRIYADVEDGNIAVASGRKMTFWLVQLSARTFNTWHLMGFCLCGDLSVDKKMPGSAHR